MRGNLFDQDSGNFLSARNTGGHFYNFHMEGFHVSLALIRLIENFDVEAVVSLVHDCQSSPLNDTGGLYTTILPGNQITRRLTTVQVFNYTSAFIGLYKLVNGVQVYLGTIAGIVPYFFAIEILPGQDISVRSLDADPVVADKFSLSFFTPKD